MDIKEVKELLTQFDQSTLTEFDLREGSFELYMNKNRGTQRGVAVEEQAYTKPVDEVVPKVGAENEQSLVAEAIPAQHSSSDDTEEIVSPLVGIAYLQPAPDKDSFKKVGDKVRKGEVVCIIEAMKLMNEITSTVDGTIVEILVENESVVEYNQPLFRVTKGE